MQICYTYEIKSSSDVDDDELKSLWLWLFYTECRICLKSALYIHTHELLSHPNEFSQNIVSILKWDARIRICISKSVV
jgi:hypothetical protein